MPTCSSGSWPTLETGGHIRRKTPEKLFHWMLIMHGINSFAYLGGQSADIFCDYSDSHRMDVTWTDMDTEAGVNYWKELDSCEEVQLPG